MSKTEVSGDRTQATKDPVAYKPIIENSGTSAALDLPNLIQQVSIPELIANYPGLYREGIGPDLEYPVRNVHRTDK